MKGYHSGGILGWRKSGDTGGYSSRIAYSALKGRAAIAADTCGGCGSQGTAGSGAQRAALLLADGPPVDSVSTEEVLPGTMDSTSNAEMVFTGDAHSHNFPSVAQINIEVTPVNDTTAIVALSSSDGAGATTNAAKAVGGGKWSISEPIFMGTGWGASKDPFNQLPQQRSLIIASDGKSATYQDMGADTSLALVGAEGVDDEGNDEKGDDSGATSSKYYGFAALFVTAITLM